MIFTLFLKIGSLRVIREKGLVIAILYPDEKKAFLPYYRNIRASQLTLVIENLPANVGDLRDVGSIPRLERSLEEGMAAYSSIFAWRIPWTEEPDGLWSMESQRVGESDMIEAT